MRRNELLLMLTIITGITVVFFYQSVFFGKIPFPGDGLMSDFQPWRSASYLGYAAGGVPNKAQYPDTYRQIYPWKTLAVNQLKQGKLPLWNPYNFSGAPLLANFQSAALYPLGLIYLLVKQTTAWTILVLLQPLLAAVFTYIYARKIKINPYGATLAAVSYGFSGFMAVWLEYNTVGHVVLWLPLILLAIEHLKDKPRARWLGILAVANAAAILAGHPQVYAYILAFSVVYTIFRTQKKVWGYIVGFSALGIGIAGLQIIPGVELIRFAARSPHDVTNLFTKILIQPWQLLALPFPNIFGNPATRTYWPSDTFVGKVTTIGLIPLFFSFSAFRRKDDVTKWFIGASGITLLLITANPITQNLYRIPIPLFTSSSPTLMAFLLSFSLSVLCGLGLDYWMTEKHSIKKLIRRTVELGIIFIVLILAAKSPALLAFHAHAAVALRAILYGGLIAAATLFLFWVAIAFPKLRNRAIILLLIIHMLDLFVFFTRFNPFVDAALVFPNHEVLSFLSDHGPDRYWGYGTAGIAANFATQYRMFSPEGYDPLYPKWYGQFLYSYRTGDIMKTFDNATRSDAAITSGFGDGGLSNPNKQKTLNVLSVRYILDRTENGSTEQTFPPTIFKEVYAFKDWRIYENTNALPRAYVTNGSATILSYEPERVVVKTETKAPDDLVLTDTYYPGWKATVDGKLTEIKRYNVALRQVAVPAGTHTVVMTYAPMSVAQGEILSIISIVGLVATLAIIKQKHHE